MENNKKNKFKVFMVLFVLLVLIAGSSYAVWRYNYNGTSNNTISSTDLSFRFLESNKEIVSIDNAVPMSDEDGIKQEGTGNVFDFEVKSKVGATTDVKYVASLEKISVDSGKTVLNDSDVKVYIEDFNGNTVLKPTKISELNSYKLFEKLHRHSRDNSEISTKYKLKVWLDSEVDVFSLENKQYKFKINVKTEQKEQDSNQSYKLVYDLDGGTGSISDSTFKVGDKVTITSVVPTKEGYNFLGWSTKKNASSASYKAGDSVTLNDAYDGSVRLYAVWESKGYKIKYDSNGGTGTISDSSYKIGESKKLTKNTFTKEGYTFVGWNTNKDASIALYTDEQVVSDLGKTGETVTLYAIWEQITYIVKYNANGGVIKNVQNIEPDVSYDPADVGIVKNELNWTKDGDVYKSEKFTNSSPKYLFFNITVEKSSVLSFDYNVSYRYEDMLEYIVFSSGLEEELSRVTIHGDFFADDPSPKGKIDLNPGSYVIAFISESGDKRVAANKAYVKNIKLSNSSDGTMDNSIFKGSGKLSKNLYQKDNYVFKGWSLDENATSVAFTDEQSVSDLSTKENDTVNLYAVWEREKYNVNVVVQNGTVDVANKEIPSFEDGMFNLTTNIDGAIGSVKCTNNQGGYISNNVLTIQNISADTTCTVKFATTWTTLFSDGTLIINENAANRKENLSTYGAVTEEYDAWSESNSYIMSDTTQPWYTKMHFITSVKIDDTIVPVSTAYWFNDAINMVGGDFNNLKAEKLIDMNSMFYDAGSDVNSFKLTGLENWDVSNVTTMMDMFYMAGYKATAFNLDLSKWDVSNVTTMRDMFKYAGTNATTWSVKIPSKTGELTNTTSKWYGSSDSIYAEPPIGKSFTLPLIVDVVVQDGALAAGESATKTGWVGQDVTFNIVPNDSSKSGFVSCTNNQTGTFKNNVLTVSNITSDTTCTVTFASLSTVLYSDGTLILNEMSTDRSNNITTHGSVTKEYVPMDESNSYVFENQTDQLWRDVSEYVTSEIVVEIGSNMKPISTKNWFRSLSTMGSADFTNLDTSNVIDMSYMFDNAGNGGAETFILNVSNFDTSNVINMSYMFYWSGLSPSSSSKKWDIGSLSEWNVSKVTDMSHMFEHAGYYSSSWDIGDISNWDVSKVTNMNSMFSDAGHSVNSFSLILSGWNTSNVTNMNSMFYAIGRSGGSFSLNLSNWNTEKVTDMSSMFYDVVHNIGTVDIDLSGWNISNVINMDNMFFSTFRGNWSVKIPSTTGSLANTTTKFYGNNENVYISSPKKITSGGGAGGGSTGGSSSSSQYEFTLAN